MKEKDDEEKFLREPNEAYEIVYDNYSLEDFKKIERKEGYKYELIDGIVCIQGAPSTIHEELFSKIFGEIWSYLKGKPCKIFGSKLGYVLSEKGIHIYDSKHINQYVEPDITVVCDKTILKKDGAYGVPTIAIEITSPRTAKVDYIDKHRIYEHFGIKEYFIVSPEYKSTIVNKLDENGKYISREYKFWEEVPIESLGDFKLKISESEEDF